MHGEGEVPKVKTPRAVPGSSVVDSIGAGGLINPQRMHEGYGSRSVCLSVRLSVTTLAATYLVIG